MTGLAFGARVLSALLLAFSVTTASLAQAPQHDVPAGLTCPCDQIVWVNTKSKVYHFQGERYFGSTKQGKFICEKPRIAKGIVLLVTVSNR